MNPPGVERQGPAILITSPAYAAETIVSRIRVVAPGAVLYGPEDFQRDPALIERIDIVLGKLPAEAFGRARRLKWIHTTAAGADWAQREPALSHPAIVTNSRIHAEPIAEHLFGLLLMLIRRLHVACRNQLAAHWGKKTTPPPDILVGKTLCVVGLGTIGRRCAELGAAFGMRVIGVRRNVKAVPSVEKVFGPEDIGQAFSQADVVMVVLPGTAETTKLIGRVELAALPTGALLLNAGRGKTVDTDALLEALSSSRLAGAGLDVVDPEPLPPDHPLWRMPNVILTPHTAGLHRSYVQNAAGIFLENLRRFLESRPMLCVVNKPLGY